MSRPGQSRGPQLPASLSEELGFKPRASASASERPFVPGGQGAKKGLVSRKQARKAEREAKKHSRSHRSNGDPRSAGRPTQGLRVIGKGVSAQLAARAPRPASQPKPKPQVAPKQSDPQTLSKSSMSSKGKERAHPPEEAQPPHKKKRVSFEQKRQQDVPTASRSDGRDDADRQTQRKNVASDALTPLQRLLAKAEGSSQKKKHMDGSGSGSSLRSSSAEAPRRKKRSQMTQAEKDEEDEIAWLEAHIGSGPAASSGGKKSTKRKRGEGQDAEDQGELSDGLDDLLGYLDNFKTGMYDADARVAEESNSDSDLESEEDDGSQGWSDEEEDSDEQMEELNSEPDVESGSDASSAASEEASEAASSSATELEDVAKAAVADAPPSRYIPPALRKAAEGTSSGDGENAGLRRQLKGLLNRMGEGNLEGIVMQLEGIYRSNSRAVVSTTLGSLILETIASSPKLTDTFVVLYAALVAALHKVIGVEFAANLVQMLVDTLLASYAKANAAADPYEDPESKKTLHLVSLLCELYNLHVVACPLIYDCVRFFAEVEREQEQVLTELSVELLLKMVKLCGNQLRGDDSSSLKQIAELVQAAAATSDKGTSSRTRFMLERIEELKQHGASKSKKSQLANQSAGEQSCTRMKKFLGGLGKKRTLRAYEPLRVTLSDLRDAERKGKWWLVGAAWTGHDGQEEMARATGVTAVRPLSDKKTSEEVQHETDRVRNKLLDYARTHGLGTTVRRDIFVTVMTSEDFADAAQKLSELRLNETQQREIIRVLLQCLDIDKVYNPYFSLIGLQLAEQSHATRFTMQYALWDFLRSIGETAVTGRKRAELMEEEDDDNSATVSETKLAHVARCYAWWIAKGVLSLNVLKTVSFTSLTPQGTLFVQLLLINTILSTQTAVPMLSLLSSSSPSASRWTDKKSLEACVIRGTTGNADLARGMLFFVRTELGEREVRRILGAAKDGRLEEGREKATRKNIKWAMEIVKNTLEVGASVDLAV